MLADALAGRRILLTGVTGFIGEGLLARLLADFPDAHPVLLVRPKGGLSARDRVDRLADRPAFARVGDAAARLAAAEIVEGDIAAPPPLPPDLDVVVHCAGDVSFDPPIDEAFQTNVHGAAALLQRLDEAAPAAHYVHVSTAFVSGWRRGAVPEARLAHQVEWRQEADAARRLRQSVEDASRSPAMLRQFSRAAAREHRRAGPLSTAEDAERRRRDWIGERLVAAGGERARSLGWTDVYTFTKALGERVVEEAGTGRPVSIVRPSIVESALVWPEPGWIEGFKMAEPVILAYGRGELPEFPAAPDALADIVPVDYVVAALLAVAASPPPPGRPEYYHVSSGARNPLNFSGLYSHVRTYFQAHPFEVAGRGAAPLPSWQWPGGPAVERVLRLAERANAAADAVVSRLPRSASARDAARSVDRRKARLEFLRRYHDLYRPYTQSEQIFADDHTLALFRSLPPQDRDRFRFDTADIDWYHYLVEVHCPAVTSSMRGMLSGRGGGRHRPVVGPLTEPAERNVLAAFDMDGTLLSTNVVESYLWLRLPGMSGADRVQELRSLAARLPRYLAAERRDRADFLRAIYRRYEGASLAELDRLVDEEVAELVLSRVSAAALRRVRSHRSAGHHTVLVTGGIRPLTRPLAPLFDEVVAAELEVDGEGRATGFLVRPPLVGEGRAAWLRHYAAANGYDLAASYAYADSHSDLPMLQAVGHPVAVNPDVTLSRLARRGRWPVEDWGRGGPAKVAG